MTTKTKPSLDEKLTPEEYDTLVALTDKAQRLVDDRLPDYIRATDHIGPERRSLGAQSYEFKSRGDRLGRDPDGRYDIVVTFTDYDGDSMDVYLPSSILWDPEGAIGRTKAAIEAARAAQEAMDAAAEAERQAAAERSEKALAAKLAKKHGYVKAAKPERRRYRYAVERQSNGRIEEYPTKGIARETAEGWVNSPLRTGPRTARVLVRAEPPVSDADGWRVVESFGSPELDLRKGESHD